jgi:D-threonine aldolase
MTKEWYTITNIDHVDSPTMVVYPDRVRENIKALIASVADVSCVRPHIKTHKSPEVCKMMLDAGITKFKCATIAEAEILANAGAPDVILAYQPVGPKAKRFAALVSRFPKTKWACLVDNVHSAKEISDVFQENQSAINAFIDLNVGMNRTGIIPENALDLFQATQNLNGIKVVGLHAYDGHLRDTDFKVRSQRCDEAFERVKKLQQQILESSGKTMILVAGGTPTFSIHQKRKNVECSPGTFVYWDKGYEDILSEQKFYHAALVVTRVISKPTDALICVDLGHKAIASENPLPNRVFFLNAPELQPTGHSEEHMVFKTAGKNYNVGDVLYGVPYHICPTVALHDVIHPINNGIAAGAWITAARKRKITL